MQCRRREWLRQTTTSIERRQTQNHLLRAPGSRGDESDGPGRPQQRRRPTRSGRERSGRVEPHSTREQRAGPEVNSWHQRSSEVSRTWDVASLTHVTASQAASSQAPRRLLCCMQPGMWNDCTAALAYTASSMDSADDSSAHRRGKGGRGASHASRGDGRGRVDFDDSGGCGFLSCGR